MAQYLVRGWVAKRVEFMVTDTGKNLALRQAIKDAKRRHEDGDGPEPIWTDTPHWETERVTE